MDDGKREHEQLSRVLERERFKACVGGVRLSCSGKENTEMLALFDVKGGGAFHVLTHSTMCKLFLNHLPCFFMF